MGLARGHHRYTYADYVAVELESSTKHEFLDGEIYAMAGGTEDHSALSAQVLRALGNAVGASIPSAGNSIDNNLVSGNTGDGGRMAESVGGHVDIRFNSPAAWMPTSKVPMGNGTFGAFPHLLDRYKPGIIGVLKNGKRFTNESNSYHDVGAAMIEASRPTTRPSASINIHFFSISEALAE